MDDAAPAAVAGWLRVVLHWDGRTSPALAGLTSVRVCSQHTAPRPRKYQRTDDGTRIAAQASATGWVAWIDSGTGHVTWATGTSATVVWTGHHQVQFYDLCDNVTHMFPEDHLSIPRSDPGVGRHFTSH